MDKLSLFGNIKGIKRLKLVRSPLISEALQNKYTALMFKFDKELDISDRRRYFATVHWDRVNHLVACGYYDEALRDEYV